MQEVEKSTADVIAAIQPAQPVAWLDKQELEYLQMVTGNKGWSGYQRVIMVGGEKEGCAPLYAAPKPLTVNDPARVPEIAEAYLDALLSEARGKLHDLMCMPGADGDFTIAKKWAGEAYDLLHQHSALRAIAEPGQ